MRSDARDDGDETSPERRCEECGAPLAEGATCRDAFDALLTLEWTLGGVGALAHFHAVASWQLQHPVASGLTAASYAALAQSVAESLDGRATIADVRRGMRASSDGATRVTRRDGDPVPVAPATWTMTIGDVLAADHDVASYAAAVARWAAAAVTVSPTRVAASAPRRR